MNRGINWPNWVSICKSKKVTFFTVGKISTISSLETSKSPKSDFLEMVDLLLSNKSPVGITCCTFSCIFSHPCCMDRFQVVIKNFYSGVGFKLTFGVYRLGLLYLGGGGVQIF